jgi:hypothetical protein
MMHASLVDLAMDVIDIVKKSYRLLVHVYYVLRMMPIFYALWAFAPKYSFLEINICKKG